MPLEYDPISSDIFYEGIVVGKYIVEKGVGRVSLNFTYECEVDEWVVPVSWFAYGLSRLRKHRLRRNAIGLTLETAEDQIEEKYSTLRLLTEKELKQSGHKWRFHKNDPDNWPSPLHGHDYEKNMTLDAITGLIYDATTRQCCEKLRGKEARRIQSELRACSDFTSKVTELIDQQPS